ncbi:MAG: hypothetical protein HOK98_15430 [Rhodospirillaceae bacterium]|jgi:predicted exporter|nr:hypothetical protein [Rhodospirillaceae bacterium]
MKPIVLSSLVLAIVLAALLSMIEVRSDAGAVLGGDAAGVGSLDTQDGRSFTIALFSTDKTRRNTAAREIAAQLENDPLVEDVHIGPAPFSPALIDWIWEWRFQLNPPRPDELTTERISERLAKARAELGRGFGMVLGDRLLRDPTGSFAELVERIRTAAHGLPQHDGIWQARDGTAALMFVTLTDRPFAAATAGQLAERILLQADRLDVNGELLGPRIIAAQISTQTTRAATFAALVATALLLVWLIWILRSVRNLLSVFLPLALGVASAALAVQLSFGSVHVIALGFGGALTGLALDYPLHLLAHGDNKRDATKRLILIGAATTAGGFGALLGSGLIALMQVGLFVAVGLIVAALAARLITTGMDTALHAPAMERLTWWLPFKAWVELVLLVLGLLVVATTTSEPGKALYEPARNVREGIDRFVPLLPLPSGRHTIIVRGETLDQLLSRQVAIGPVLGTAISDGTLERFAMAAQFIAPSTELDLAKLPTSEEFRRRAADALRTNKMSLSFSLVQVEEYLAALSVRALTAEDLAALPELRGLFGRLEQTASGWRESVHLFGLSDPDGVARAIQKSGVPGVEMFDIKTRIEMDMAKLRQRVGIWLGIGAIVALAILVIGLSDWRRALAITRTTAAATSITAACLALGGATLGVFQIVALTLVVGIGIDYGLFLVRNDGAPPVRAHCRSVALCAGSTLIAFAVMGLASVEILQEVGLAVSLGVVIMVVLNLAHSRRSEPTFKNQDAG